jgi:hypothetical protein
MPESVADRCTKSHEYVFLLSKSQKYFYDSDAVKEISVCAGTRPSAEKGSFVAKGEPLPGQLPFRAVTESRNKRSVWSVATKPYSEAHFATFPMELIEPCILAGTSERGCCPECAAGHVRITESKIKIGHTGDTDSAYPVGSTANRLALLRQAARAQGQEYTGERITTGWEPQCKCVHDKTVPSVVLDPFSGAGTTGVVALKHGRKYVGLELNPEYADMSVRRILQEAAQRPLFS